MSNSRADNFLEKKKDEVKNKMVNKKTGEKAKHSKMPEALRKHFENKGKK